MQFRVVLPDGHVYKMCSEATTLADLRVDCINMVQLLNMVFCRAVIDCLTHIVKSRIV